MDSSSSLLRQRYRHNSKVNSFHRRNIWEARTFLKESRSSSSLWFTRLRSNSEVQRTQQRRRSNRMSKGRANPPPRCPMKMGSRSSSQASYLSYRVNLRRRAWQIRRRSLCRAARLVSSRPRRLMLRNSSVKTSSSHRPSSTLICSSRASTASPTT